MVLLRRLACGLWLLWLTGCREDKPQLEQLIQSATPRLEAFARFEVWAHRAQDAMPKAPKGSTALAEATFSPIRNSQDVVFALVEHHDRETRRLGFPKGIQLPEKLVWQPIRSPSLGTIKAVALRPCAVSLPGWWRDGAANSPCLVLARKANREAGDSLRVLVGFRMEEAAAVAQE